MASAEFVSSIDANVSYWQGRIDACDDPSLRALGEESENIYRAIEFGLALPETCQSAAELILKLYYFIEHRGEWRHWQGLLQGALKQCDENCALRLRLLDLSVQGYRHARDWESSFAANKEAAALAKALGENAYLSRAQHNLAKLYWRQRKNEKAITQCRLALNGFSASGADTRQMGGVYATLGLIEDGRGNSSEAIDAHQNAVHYFRLAEFPVFLARALVNLALAQEVGGDVDAALANYLEARQILEGSEYEREKARIELSFGSLLFNLNRFDEAEEAYLRAHAATLESGGSNYFLGLSTNNLGNVYLEQGRFGEAEVILRESLVHWKRANAGLQLANSLGSLAKVFAAQKRVDEALVFFDKALNGAEKFPDDRWAKELLHEYGLERKHLLER